MKKRTAKRDIRLLSSGTQVKFDPTGWLLISSAKEFDETQTKILRVFQYRDDRRVMQERFLVYGSRGAEWDAKARRYKTHVEGNELVAAKDAVPDALAKVAAHCGVTELITRMVDRGER